MYKLHGQPTEERSMEVTRKHMNQRMSQLVVCNGIAYLAGQVALLAQGKSVTEQTKDVLARIDSLLADAKTDKSKLLTATIWLADIATFDEMNEVWDAWVSPGNPPARATVGAQLAAPQYAVEIQVTALGAS
jgi:enamine deaminase RidA (YjgF/YER057c/UK114 family)